MSTYNYQIELQRRKKAGESQPGLSVHQSAMQQLRQWAHNYPQYEQWQITLVRGNNKYDIRHGDTGRTFSFVKAITEEPADFQVDDTVVVGFYDSSRNDPFILALGVTPVEPVATTTNWPTMYASGSRNNSVESIVFDELTAVSGVPPITNPCYNLRQWEGKLAWHDFGTKIYVDDVEVFDGSSLGADFYYFSGGLSYQDGVIYALHSDCAVLAIQDDGTLLWNWVVFNDWGISGGYYPGTWDTNSDPVVVGNRVLMIGDRSDIGGRLMASIDIATGTNPWNTWITPASGYIDTLVTWNQWSLRPRFWVADNEDLVYFSEYSGRIVCLRVDDANLSLEWINELDPVIERRRAIFGIVEDALICAYEQHEWEEVQDRILDVDWDGDLTVSPRFTYKSPADMPVGVHSGFESLSIADGSLLGENPLPGAMDWNTYYGPITDYYANGPIYDWGPVEGSDWLEDLQGSYEILTNDPDTGEYDYYLFPEEYIPLKSGAPDSGYSICAVSTNVSAFDLSYLWEDQDYDPNDSPEWDSWVSTNYTEPFDFELEEATFDKTFWDVSNASAASYFSEWEKQRFEGMGGTKNDPDDYLRQAFVRLSYSARLVGWTGGGFDQGSHLNQSLTIQHPTFTELGHPIYNSNAFNGMFVETYAGGLGDIFEDWRPVEALTGPAGGGGTLSTYVWAPDSPGHLRASGPAATMSYKYLWRNRKSRSIQRTPTPPIYTGCSGRIGKTLIVAGIGEVDGVDVLQWRAFNRLVVEQWRYEVTEGSENLSLRGSPFVTAGKVHTSISRGTNYKLLTLDVSGRLVSEVDAPYLRNPTFNGTDTWISRDGVSTFGPLTT